MLFKKLKLANTLEFSTNIIPKFFKLHMKDMLNSVSL
jgi:hypothetical protein